MRPALRNLLLSDAVKATLDYQFSRDRSLTGVGPPLTHSCTTKRTYFDATGTLQTSEHNLLTYSNTFDNAAWTKTRSNILSNIMLSSQDLRSSGAGNPVAWWINGSSTVTPAASVFYDGTTIGNSIVEAAGSATHYVASHGSVVAAGLTWTISVSIKGLSGSVQRYVRLQIDDGSFTDGCRCLFNPNTGAISKAAEAYGAGTLTSATTTSEGLGWYRVTLSGTVNTSDTTPLFSAYMQNQTSSYTATYTGDGTSGISATAIQVVNSATAETYTATTSAAVPIPFTGPGNGGPSVAYKLVEDATATNSHSASNSAGVTLVSTTYTESVYLKAGERTWARLILFADSANKDCYFNLGTGALGTASAGVAGSIESLGSGWYRAKLAYTVATGAAGSITVLSATGDGGSTYSGDGVSGIYIAGGQLEQTSAATSYKETTSAAYYAPVFDHDPVTLRSLGQSLWEARTNSIRNNKMQGAVAGTPGTNPTNWTIATPQDGVDKSIVAVGTTNGITTLDVRWSGTSSTGGTSNLVLFESNTQITAANLDVWTGSLYAALVGGSLANISALAINIRYNDAAGALLTSQSVSILSLTSALSRFTNTFTAANASIARVNLQIVYDFANSSAIDFTLRIGMPQLELGAFVTPVIATYGAAATRAAPSCSTTDLSWYNASEGAFVAEYMVPTININQRVFTLRDGSAADALVGMFTNSGGGGNYFAAKVGGSETATVPASHTPVGGTFYKLAGAYQENNTNGARNGTLGTNDVACAMPTGITTLQIGATVNSQFINGYLQSLTYYPRRLPDTQLQRLSA